jgi:ElaB/YqjD/DUF883 family membrane-anchored ribosome-binding protein
MADASFNPKDKGGYPQGSESGPGTSLKDRAVEEAAALSAKTRETAAFAAAKTKDVASSTFQMAGDAAHAIGHKAEAAVDMVGENMRSLAGTIREQAPAGGMWGSAGSGVADTLESGGAYLQERNLHGMAGDTANLIRRYPLQAILVGLGVGFLVGRSVRS